MKHLLFILILAQSTCFAQTEVDTILPVKQYEAFIQEKWDGLSFLHSERVSLEQSESLKSFFNQCLTLHQSKKKINMVHLGDSHIQAGYLSGMVRRGLQQRFGNAGRGLVFTYRLAKSNGPHDYVSFSDNSWKSIRNVMANDSMQTGISGFSIMCSDSLISLGISLRNNEGLNYAFNELQLFYTSSLKAVLTVTDSTGLDTAKLVLKTNSHIPTFRFNKPVNNLKITVKNDSVFSLYGINLMNDSSGIIYHTIGVNGSEYRHFATQPLFFDQLKNLNADLYILSLGTNEAFAKSFDGNSFIQSVDSLIHKLKIISPEAGFLITSPPESCRRIKRGVFVPNENVVVISKLLQQYCRNNNIAFYNLYSYNGGKGSMLKYAKQKMTDARRIHFNRAGYEIQGLMLLKALMQSM
jgi:lysophospholipase L1-like esterase